MTQAELAKKVKVTQSYISQLEAGTKKELGDFTQELARRPPS